MTTAVDLPRGAVTDAPLLGRRHVGGFVERQVDFIFQLLQLILTGKTLLHQQRAEPLDRIMLGIGNAFSFGAIQFFVVGQ